ncbi:DNA topoisomerase IV subunit A [Bacillus thermotolerans]|uniref:DNA topoisomerase IV subunit A n=1 Tax=Bacillus thermotolerans TaxID=1221996 RepID=UPI00057EFD0C|nr:DNA topoisomerase IV subunit A [Bacillus thermotolerans]KKB38819.1 Topoisomerase IV subunit A [Bacillus thermotolerans]
MQKEIFQDLPLEEVLGDRFGRYSKYIIQERALPDARDGLKPVQRRILYAMYAEGNTQDKPFRKSAKTVGNVIGNYHPHGDSSVYEAMVRMSQDWKLRQVLIEMHGNNGSIDGDPPAAMRYTEARLSAISSELLKDIEKRTVEFIPNFDDTSEEPIVLPARFPNLLVNGSTGISAGYATEIPPHQLGEVIDATVMRMDHPECTVADLMTVIKGPDFPTGGIIQGKEGIEKAYETGKGKIIVRGKAEIEEIRGGKKQIVITELPYDVNKASLVKKMDEFRVDRKVEGIAEVRDETDRTGLRIVIELKKDGDAEGILNYLYKASDLQISYNFNMVAIHEQRPVQMGLIQMLDAYIRHQKEVVTKRSQYELAKARARHHIVEGLIKALSILDQVIEVIRSSKDKRDAKHNLIDSFAFTEAQAEAIVTLQLYRLTNTDIAALEKEADQLETDIKKLEEILASEKKLASVIKKELKDIKKKYTDERRTVIQDEIEEIKVNLEVLIPNEEVIVTVTKDGYIKRTSLRSYSASNGKDLAMKETDRLLYKKEVNTTDVLLLFTNKGNYLYMPVHELPDIRWKDLGQHLASLVAISKDESIIAAFDIQDFQEPLYFLFATRNGMLKRTELASYKVQRYSKPLTAIKLKGEDEVAAVHLTDGSQHVLLATAFGYGLRFSEEEASIVGPRAAGVKGINLKDGDTVVSAAVWEAEKERELLIVTHRGAVKKMNTSEFEPASRAGRGVIMLRELKKNSHRLVELHLTEPGEEVVLQTDKGLVESFDFSYLKQSDRYSNGSFVIDAKENGQVTEVWTTTSSDE